MKLKEKRKEWEVVKKEEENVGRKENRKERMIRENNICETVRQRKLLKMAGQTGLKQAKRRERCEVEELIND